MQRNKDKSESKKNSKPVSSVVPVNGIMLKSGPKNKQASKKAAAAAAAVRSVAPETEGGMGRAPEHDVGVRDASPETETPDGRLPTDRYADYMGDTPLVELTHMVRSFKSPDVRVFAKCEFFNPSLSIKDRIVYNIFDEAEAEGRLRAGMTVVAASSGNTGASVAMVCAMRGYKCIVTTSPKCSREKMDAIRAYGAKLVVSPAGAKEGEPTHYMEIARLMALEDPDHFFDVDQYETKSNPAGHYKTLGPELMEQTCGAITHFVAAGSTGGTISGVGAYLKEHKEDVKVILADPVGSVFTNYFRTGKLGEAKKFLVEGVGKGSIPGAMDMTLVDDVLPVSDQQAFDMCHELARTQGICPGGSAGLNVFAALEFASQCDGPAVIVTVMPDSGPKNLSKVYNPEWLAANGFSVPADVDLLSGPTPCGPRGDPEETETKARTPFERLREADAHLAPESSNSFQMSQANTVKIDACLYKDLVGDTPLVELTGMCASLGNPETRIYAKAEFFNPGYSIKDRIVQNILDKAEADGRLRAGMTIVAASSGNTGASTAMMAAMRGYKCIITTSPKCSCEKMNAIKAYGAQLIVSPPGVPEGHDDHYMMIARNLALEDPDRYFDVDQYDTQSNPEGHFLTLGPEIYEQTKGKVTHFIAGGSTGGTISGTSRFLKAQNPDVKAVLADPIGSIFTGYFKTGKVGKAEKFCVEGVGKGSIPGAMNFPIIDDVITVSDQDAFDMCHRLCREEGICAGGSSGMNLTAALRLAEQSEEPAVIVTVLCDLGCKYLSKIYSNEWLVENGFNPAPEPEV